LRLELAVDGTETRGLLEFHTLWHGCELNHLPMNGWHWKIKKNRETTTDSIDCVGGNDCPCVLILCRMGARLLLPADPPAQHGDG
jgi:hypothetical protein